MQQIFTICFVVGILYSIINFILGSLISLDSNINFISTTIFKPTCIASFITVFGGIGLLLIEKSINNFYALIISLILGFVISYIIYRFVIIPLNKAQNTSTVSIKTLIGNDAIVIQKIFPGKYGKILYKINGNTLTAPAKSDLKDEIPCNTIVKITSIDKNTYYVRKKYN